MENQLAVLLGRAPGDETGTAEARLPRLPPLRETGAPAELVRRRPDPEVARRRLQAADRDLAAVNNRYPRFNLTGSMMTATEDPSDFLRDWLGTAAGDVVAPIVRYSQDFVVPSVEPSLVGCPERLEGPERPASFRSRPSAG